MAARLPLPITIEKKRKPAEDVELHELSSSNEAQEIPEDGQEATPENSRDNRKSEEDEDFESLTLEDHAMIVTAILKPVAVTMLIVITIVYGLSVASAPKTNIAFMIYQEKPSDSTGVKFAGAVIDAVIFVVMIVAVTFLLVLLYKYRCLKIIYGWLIMACAVLLGGFGAILYLRVFSVYNLPLDWITFGFLVWNFTVLGMVSIFWHSPERFTQGYLVIISALLACFFTRLPEWTTWAILIAVAIYDLFAVLCPKGPLKMLVDMSKERDEPIPALLYNGSVVWLGTDIKEKKSDDSESESGELEPENQDLESQEPVAVETNGVDNPGSSLLHEDEEVAEEVDMDDKIELHRSAELNQSVRLGLGDFVFYSVLMGRAAMYDIVTVFTCFIAIITGLFFTLVLLAIFRKALPALPISILLGTVFYLLTNIFLVPYVLVLGAHGVFV